MALAVSALVMLGGCSEAASSGSVDDASALPRPSSAAPSRDAGAVTKTIVLCVDNDLSGPIGVSPTSPEGMSTTVDPGRDACHSGDNRGRDPGVVITVANDLVVHVSTYAPVFGLPIIRLCSDPDCNTVHREDRLSVGYSTSRTLDGVTYTALRTEDSEDGFDSFVNISLTVS